VTTNPANDRYPAWFADGSTIAFVSDRTGRAAIWRAPRLDGDAATLLIRDADEPAISPNGTEIAFVRPRGGYKRLAVARVDTPSSVRFITTDSDGKWDHSRPAWSPDGETICYDAWDGLWLVPAHGGAARRLTTADAHNDSEPAWSADGHYVYFSGLHDRQWALWRIGREGGTAERVTVGSGTERTPRVVDGRIIAFTTASATRDIVVRDLAAGQETQFGSSRDDIFPVFSPDGGKIYFISDRWGSFDIWAQDMNAGKTVGAAYRLAENEGVESHLACSPDGRWIAYYRILNGRRDIFILPSDGGSLQRVTDDPSGAMDPAWSPDGTQLAFSSEREGASQIWTQRLADGKTIGPPRRITSGPGFRRAPSWSPDGSAIAFAIITGPASAEAALVAVTGGAPRVLTSGANVRYLRWNANAGGLLVADRFGTSQFAIHLVDPGGAALTKPPVLTIGANSPLFDVSRDGRFIAYPRGASEGDIWILEGGSRRF
jgi:Tol biopolymer transport system component